MIEGYSRKPLVGYEDMYEIDTNGNIFSLERVVVTSNGKKQIVKARQRTLSNHCTGYLTICILKKTYRVHRLVALTFLGNPPAGKECVNHINGNKKDNRVSNLEWCSNQENTDHAKAIGLIDQIGVKNQSAKLSIDDIEICLSLVKSGIMIKDIATKFEVSRNTVPKALDREFGFSWREYLKPQYAKKLNNIGS